MKGCAYEGVCKGEKRREGEEEERREERRRGRRRVGERKRVYKRNLNHEV